MKKNTNRIGDLNLLPNYFKKIALALIIFSVILLVLSLIFDFPVDKETLRNIFINLIIISCILIAVSRDKIEDEMTTRIKLVAGFAAFLVGAMTFVSSSITPWLADDFVFFNSQGLLLFMSLFFLSTKYILTKQSKNEELD